MHCPNCGREIPDGSKFCPYCGASLEGAIKKENYNHSSKSSRIIIPVVLIIVLLFSVFAFVKIINKNNPSNMIIGTWIPTGGQIEDLESIEFFKDGTVKIYYTDDSPVTATYKFLDNSNIKLSSQGDSVIIQYAFSSSGNTLTLTDKETGDKTIFQKKK